MTATTQTVRDIALEQPSSIRVFEQFGIDYCCGGRKPLSEACEAQNLRVDEVIAALERAAKSNTAAPSAWATASLATLAAHIVNMHHSYVQRELPRLYALAAKVVNRHGPSHAELPTIEAKLAQLGDELTHHLAKEEMILFPHIASLENAIAKGAPRPTGCFGTVAHPIAMMTQEHDAAGTLMAQIRELSSDYSTPPGACPTYHAFFDGLREFEEDLHQHIHLENNILFPRAIAMEAAS